MSTARPFAYNTGLPIPGTQQIGDLAVGTPDVGFGATVVEWWDGPDEELGYVIAVPVSGDTQPTPVPGVTASVGFYRTKTFTDNEFISLSEFVSTKFGNSQTFSSATDASLWLTNNGFWNSYVTPLLYLDAGNPASYPGTGTVWTDIIGGKTFNLINGPSYDSANGGKIYFDSASSQYAQCNTSLSSLSTWSVSVWHYYTGQNTGSSPCIVSEVYPGSTNKINFIIGNGSDTNPDLQTGFYNDGWWVTNNGYTLTPNNWYYIVGTYDGSTLKLYVNNTLINTTYGITYNSLSSQGGIYLMSRWDNVPSELWDGYLSTVGIYNKDLSPYQISSIWNLEKTRFGYSGFTLSSSDFTNQNWGSYITPLGNSGFTTTGQAGPGEAFYAPNLSLNNGGNPVKLAEIRAFWTDNGLNVNSNSYMFNVTWGAGSTLSSGVVIMQFYDFGDNNAYLNFGVVDTSNPIWQTSGTGYYNGPIYTLAGTWNLGATFTLITPLIVNGQDWC